MQLLFSLLFVVTIASFCNGDPTVLETCELIKQLECHTFITHVACGTNGVTYNTRCDFSKAHCNDSSILYLHGNACNRTQIDSTTPNQMQFTTPNTHEIIKETFCQAAEGLLCIPDGQHVCGSNGISYFSLCEFSKAQCNDPLLRYLHTDACNNTEEFVTETFCRAAEEWVCVAEGQYICGSNGISYLSMCDFDKARCKDHSISMKSEGHCQQN